MAIDDLKNKYFALKNKNGCFCSKCGKRILNDSYQLSKHQEECVIYEDKYKALEDGNVYGYAFRIKNGKLVFIVYQLLLELSPGFSNKYNGAKWKVIFKTTFSLGSKELIEEGLYNIDVWFKMLLEKADSVCLNKENPDKIIKTCFKSIPFIYSYGDFLDIYRQRGYHYNPINIDKIKQIDDKCAKIKPSGIYNVIVKVQEHEIDDNVVLELNAFDKKEKLARVFISKDFYYCDKDIDYSEIFGLKGYIRKTRYGDELHKTNVEYVIGDISKFKSKYPELLIDNYFASGGKNLFQIVMSANYNKMIENLAKGGLGYISDHIEKLKNVNIYGNNVKEIFGQKINIIKHFNNKYSYEYLLNDDIFDVVKRIHDIQPAILSLNLTPDAIHLLYNNLTKRRDRYLDRKIRGIDTFNKDEWLKLVRKFCEDEIDIYYYRDYMDMCYELNAYPYGKIPKDILLAHEYTSEIYECNKNKVLSEKFNKFVQSEKYMLLDSTAEKGKDDKIHYKRSEDDFRIIVPKTQHDLTKESEFLNHCVRTYIGKVADEKTFILFLRKKDDLKKPYATIEVTPDMTLIQLKAVNNTKASLEAQQFVKNWAKEKNIKINSYDFTI